jgi:type IV pilus assembly protein PilB
VHLGFLPERAMLETVGEQLGVPFVEIGDRAIPARVIALVPEKLVRGRKVLPLELLGGGKRGPLVVALADPADLHLIDEIAFATGMSVKPVLAAEPDLDAAIALHLDGVVVQREVGFEGREDAIDLPEDTSPLTDRDLVGGRERKILH